MPQMSPMSWILLPSLLLVVLFSFNALYPQQLKMNDKPLIPTPLTKAKEMKKW